MKGIRLIWFYSKGVENILSQFCMVIYSKWQITYNTYKYHNSRNTKDLSYDLVTPEDFNCKFTPTLQGLYIYRIKNRKDSNIFRTISTNNITILEKSVIY